MGNERHILVSTGYKSYFDPVDKTSTGIFNKEQLQVLGRLIIYSIPYVGQAIFIGETISGYDAFTGRKLSAEERIANVLLLGFGELLGVARGASREVDAEARAEISMIDSADKEIGDVTKGTEAISGDGRTVSDSDINTTENIGDAGSRSYY